MCYLISLSLPLDLVSSWFNVVFNCHLLAFIILWWTSGLSGCLFFCQTIKYYSLGVPSGDWLPGELVSWTVVVHTDGVAE